MNKPTSEEMRKKIRDAEAELPSLLASADKISAAAKEVTFSGWLRREVRASKKPPTVLIQESGIDRVDFVDFLEGAAGLSSLQIDRLVSALGLELSATHKSA